MADYGVNRRFTRDKLPLQVLIGFFPTEPVKLSSLAAPAELDPENPTSVAIKSGMAIVKDADGNFAAASAADQNNGKTIYIALHDASSLDVQASGKLVGLDCSDKFEVQTGYYDPDVTSWNEGDALTVTDGGVFTNDLAENDAIVGYVTKVTDANGLLPYVGKTPSTLASDAFVLQFKTAQNGQVKTA